MCSTYLYQSWIYLQNSGEENYENVGNFSDDDYPNVSNDAAFLNLEIVMQARLFFQKII